MILTTSVVEVFRKPFWSVPTFYHKQVIAYVCLYVQILQQAIKKYDFMMKRLQRITFQIFIALISSPTFIQNSSQMQRNEKMKLKAFKAMKFEDQLKTKYLPFKRQSLRHDGHIRKQKKRIRKYRRWIQHSTYDREYPSLLIFHFFKKEIGKESFYFLKSLSHIYNRLNKLQEFIIKTARMHQQELENNFQTALVGGEQAQARMKKNRSREKNPRGHNNLPNLSRFVHSAIHKAFPKRIPYFFQDEKIKSIQTLVLLYKVKKYLTSTQIDTLLKIIDKKVESMIKKQNKNKQKAIIDRLIYHEKVYRRCIIKLDQFRRIMIQVLRHGTASDAEIKDFLGRLFDGVKSNIGKQGRIAIQGNKFIDNQHYIRQFIDQQPPPQTDQSQPLEPQLPLPLIFQDFEVPVNDDFSVFNFFNEDTPLEKKQISAQDYLQIEEMVPDYDIFDMMILEPVDPQVLNISDF